MPIMYKRVHDIGICQMINWTHEESGPLDRQTGKPQIGLGYTECTIASILGHSDP